MIPFAARLGWRLGRGQTARMGLLIACVAIGVAARVCVGSFTGAFDAALAREARPMLGADLEIIANQPLSAEQQRELAGLLPPGARTTRRLGFVTMASTTAGGAAHTAEVRAVEAAYPLLGSLVVVGGDGRPVTADFAGDVAYVQRELLAQIGASIGGGLRLGQREFRIAGVISEEPGLGANPFALGPRVLIGLDRAGSTGLTGPGARLRHGTLIALAEPGATDALAAQLRARWKLPENTISGFGGRIDNERGITVRTARQAQPSISRAFDRIADYLRLVSLVALLVGGVGVASMVRGFLHAHLDEVATLQILGGSSARVAGVFLLQALGVGLAGGAIGALAGTAIENLALLALRDSLPVAVPFAADAGALLWGLTLGVLGAGLFAGLALVDLAGLPPLAILRGDAAVARSRPLALAAGGAVVLVVAALAAIESRSLILGPALVAALVVGAGVTYALGGLILPRLARLRVGLGFGVRHGLANLGRAGFRPRSALVALCLASLLFATLAIHQRSLEAELDPAERDDLPSLFAIDLQADQLDAFRVLLKDRFAITACVLSPVVRGRYRGRNGESVPTAGALATREAERDQFLRDREQNLSWRPTPGSDNTIVAGTWMNDDPARTEASLEIRFAESIGARLGDTLAFDIQGVRLDAVVTSLRRVRWASLRPNFFVLLSPHALTEAPTTWLAAVPALAPARRAEVQAAIARSFANITVFDIAEVGERIKLVIGRIAGAVRFLGLACLAAGLVVVAGIGLATARERRTDAALLKVLGGDNRVLAASLIAEFAALGAVAAALGLGQALLLGWLVVTRLMDLELSIPWLELTVVAAALVVLSAAAGLAACRPVFTARPLAVLREE